MLYIDSFNKKTLALNTEETQSSFVLNAFHHIISFILALWLKPYLCFVSVGLLLFLGNSYLFLKLPSMCSLSEYSVNDNLGEVNCKFRFDVHRKHCLFLFLIVGWQFLGP